jgi:hypothetical protein
MNIKSKNNRMVINDIGLSYIIAIILLAIITVYSFLLIYKQGIYQLETIFCKKPSCILIGPFIPPLFIIVFLSLFSILRVVIDKDSGMMNFYRFRIMKPQILKMDLSDIKSVEYWRNKYVNKESTLKESKENLTESLFLNSSKHGILLLIENELTISEGNIKNTKIYTQAREISAFLNIPLREKKL